MTDPRSSTRRSSRGSLVVIGVLAAGLCGAELALIANGPLAPFWVVTLLPLLGMTYVAIGLAAGIAGRATAPAPSSRSAG